MTTSIQPRTGKSHEPNEINKSVTREDTISITDGKVVNEVTADILNAESEYATEYMRKLLWRIDLFLLPVMWFCFGTQQADKTALSTQAIFGIIKDTKMKGQDLACKHSLIPSECIGTYFASLQNRLIQLFTIVDTSIRNSLHL